LFEQALKIDSDNSEALAGKANTALFEYIVSPRAVADYVDAKAVGRCRKRLTERTWPFDSGSASRSPSPRLIVERASPVIFETTARPPRGAHLRRRKQPPPRSSSFEPTASHRCRIALSSIM
jgi:hypothetical protein